MDTPEADSDTAAPIEPERWPGDPGEGVEPVYAGSWDDLTPSQRAAYMRGRKSWKASQNTGEEGEGQRDGSGRTVSVPPPQSPRDRLRFEMENAPLPSDRIRAAAELGRLERAELDSVTDEVALWLAQRDTLMTLPPTARMSYLLGELGEVGGDGDTTTEEEEDAPDLADFLRWEEGGHPRAEEGRDSG